MPGQQKPLELSQLIKSLRAELVEAQRDGEGSDICFTVEDVELELDISAEEDIEGGIAAKFYVLTSHYKANKKDVVTQKITLNLKPRAADGGPLDVSDDDRVN